MRTPCAGASRGNVADASHALARQPILAGAARDAPDEPALAFGDHRMGYGELAQRARHAAASLRRLGVAPGDVVAALLPNGPAFVELLHAVDARRATLLPLNTRLAPPELAFQIEHARARVLLHGGGGLASKARAALSTAGRDVPAVEIDLHADAGLAACAAATPPPRGAPPPDDDPPLAVLYTSGTTGRPKGALLPRESFLASALASALHLGAAASDRWLACMPLFHVAGLAIPIRCALGRTPAVVHARFDADAVARALERDDITHVSLAPAMLARLLDARGGRRAPASLRCVLVGGGPVPEPLLARAAELGYPLAPTYGLTEAASQVATRRPGDADATALAPLPGVELRIAAASGGDAPRGGVGEILVRGPMLLRGYLRQPEASEAALRDGWLHTGDVGWLDEAGRLHALDRRRDLIVTGGENVYPAEVEAALLAHPAIREAAVAGLPDPLLGRRPVAWIAAHPDAPSDGDLRAFCRELLAGYKVPVAFHRVGRLPRNASGKVLRARLVEEIPP